MQKCFCLKIIFFMFLANLIFVVSLLKIHQAEYFESSDVIVVKKQVYWKFISFRQSGYSNILTRVKKKIKWLVVERQEVQIDQTRILVRLVTVIIVLLSLYRDVFRTLAHLMPEAYSKPFQISTMIGHIENPGTVKIVYSE